MAQEEIRQLFQKHLYEQLTREEIARLKLLVGKIDNKSLEKNLQEIWGNYNVGDNRNAEAFDTISKNIKEIIQPQKSIRMFYYLTRAVVAAIFLILFSFTTYLYMDRKEMHASIKHEYQVFTDKGERASITLPDGTTVVLNAKSTLSYPASFALNNRTVCLSGEAYFEVRHNDKVPFIVKTQEAQIKVLGTTFNLYAYSEDFWFEASLVEGSIEVTPYKNPDKQVCLVPFQKVRYNHLTGEVKVSETDLKIETAWKLGDLIFRNQPIHEIIKQLELYYGVDISSEGRQPEDLFTGSFHEDDISQVLRNLQQHYTFNYQKSGNEISIKFN